MTDLSNDQPTGLPQLTPQSPVTPTGDMPDAAVTGLDLIVKKLDSMESTLLGMTGLMTSVVEAKTSSDAKLGESSIHVATISASVQAIQEAVSPIADIYASLGQAVASLDAMSNAIITLTGNGQMTNESTLNMLDSIRHEVMAIKATDFSATMRIDGNGAEFKSLLELMNYLASTEFTKRFDENTATAINAIDGLAMALDPFVKAITVGKDQNVHSEILTPIKSLLELMGNEKLMKAIDKNKYLWPTAVDLLVDANRKLIKSITTTAKGEASHKLVTSALKSLADGLRNLTDALKESTKLVIALTGCVGAIALIFTFVSGETIVKATVGFPAICAGVALGIYVISKAAKDIKGDEFKQFAFAVGAIALSVLAFNAVQWSAIPKGIAALTALTLALAVSVKVMSVVGKKQMVEFGKSIIMFSASVGILGLSLLVLSYAFANVDWAMLGKGAAALGVTMIILTAGLAIASLGKNLVKDFGWNVLALSASLVILGLALPWFETQMADVKPETYWKAVGCIGVLVASVTIMGALAKEAKGAGMALLMTVAALAVVPFVLQLYDDVTWESMVKPGVVLASLVGAMVLVSQFAPNAMVGAGALLVTAVAVGVAAYAIKMYNEVSWEDYGKAMATVVGLGLAIAGLGYVGPMVLLGAAGLLGAGAALLVIGKGLVAMPQWDITQYLSVAAGIVAIGGATVAIGALGVMALMGAAALTASGIALLAFSKGVSKMPPIPIDDYLVMAGGIVALGGAFALIGNPFTLIPMLAGAAEGVVLGNALYKLGTGLAQCAGLDLASAFASATAVLDWANQTTDTIAAGFSFRKFLKAMLGLEPISKLGNTLGTIVNAIQDMANGTYNEYEVDENGNLKVVGVKQIGPEVYAKFADSISQMITGISEPLKQFGAGGGLFRKSDAEKGMEAMSHIGSIISPMIEVAKNVEAIEKADFSMLSSRFRDFFGVDDSGKTLPNGLVEVIRQIGANNRGGWFRSSDLENGIKVMSGIDAIVSPFVEIAKNSEDIEKANFTAFGEGIQAIKPFVQELCALDATIPEELNLSTSIDTLTSSIKDLDKYDSTLTLIKDVGHAIDSIANTDINKLRTVKSEAAKELYKRLDSMQERLDAIEANTKPVVYDDAALGLDTSKPSQGGDTTVPSTVNLQVISGQLQRIYGAIVTSR